MVKQNIINTLSKKNKNIDIIKNDKNYIVDISQVKIKGKYLVKKYLKKNKKIHVAYNKVPVDILGDYNFERAIFYRNKKNVKFLHEGACYIFHLNLLKEVENNLWINLLLVMTKYYKRNLYGTDHIFRSVLYISTYNREKLVKSSKNIIFVRGYPRYSEIR